ncbi:MAG: hypothetical protein JWR26_2922 [Pedosphaera sp.]|nr:hypothetical protein [Pedosphaera sp.]
MSRFIVVVISLEELKAPDSLGVAVEAEMAADSLEGDFRHFVSPWNHWRYSLQGHEVDFS